MGFVDRFGLRKNPDSKRGVAAQEDLGEESVEPRVAASKAAPGSERVSLHATYDTQPSIATDAKGVPWVAWVGHAKGEDKIHVARQDGGGWTKPAAVTSRGGDYVRPVLERFGDTFREVEGASHGETG